MSTDPPPGDPTLVNPRLQREAVLVVQDFGRIGVLIGLCTLAGVLAGFALAMVALPQHSGTCEEASALQLPPRAAPVTPTPNPPVAPQTPFWNGPGGGAHLWFGPNSLDIQPSARAYLGVITENDADGAKVTGVAPRSPAAAAGITAGDVITEVDGEQVGTPSQLAAVIGGMDPGKEVDVKVLRGGKPMTLHAKVGPRP